MAKRRCDNCGDEHMCKAAPKAATKTEETKVDDESTKTATKTEETKTTKQPATKTAAAGGGSLRKALGMIWNGE